MKIKEGFILREVAESFIVVAVGKAGKEFNGLITLNESGAFLWKNLLKETSSDELVKALLNEYDVNEEEAKKDVEEFINKLQRNKIIE